MEVKTSPAPDESKRLQACINDLVSVQALASVWSGQEPHQIVDSLLEVLVRVLRLDFAYAHVGESIEGSCIEVVRRPGQPNTDPREINQAFASWLIRNRVGSPRSMPNPVGKGELYLAHLGLGLRDEIGTIVGGSQRADFPTETEMLLLRVAANQAAIGLQEARRMREQKREAGELKRRVTERTAQLHESQQRLQIILENSPTIVFLKDIHGRYLDCNPPFEKLCGLSRNQIIGKTDWELFPAEQAVQFASNDIEVLRAGRPIDFEETARYTDGLHTRIVAKFPLRNAEDEMYAIGGIVTDITERKRAEAELLVLKDELAAELNAMTRLHEFSTRLLASTELGPLLEEALDATIELQSADFGVVQLYKPQTQALEIVAQRGFQQDFLDYFSSVHEDSSACGRALQRRERVTIEDVETDVAFEPHRQIAAAAGFRAVQSTPLFSRSGEPLGMISTHFRQPHRPSERELRLTDLYVVHAAELIERNQARAALEQAFEEIDNLKVRLHHENVALREEIDRTLMFEEIVGSSPAVKSVLVRVAKVAPMDSTVLITGETGTGKELIARAIHKRSKRSGRAFVAFNCAGIPPTLIASELFGHEKGAFTGAQQRRLGRFELAAGGTIFLDEIGELPAETQIALLRVLQEREFERVGGSQPISIDVRVVAASNRDLQEAIAAGTFRLDLFHRLNVFPIEVPSLRERKEDIPMLLDYFIKRYAEKAGKTIRSIDKKTVELFKSYSWPGNIRELQNVIERSMIVGESEVFSVDPSWLSTAPVQPNGGSSTLAERLHDQEKKIIEASLAESKGRIAGRCGAAAKLGIPSSTMESKIKLLKINKNQFKAQ